MKKILFTLLIFTTVSIKSQNKVIKANPLGLAFGIANVGFEYSERENQSTTFSVLYYSKSDLKGFGVGLEKKILF
ncbi:hypothetical protein [uncultured Polaribacter sp.]|uniref:hypothetical protein n=1 Tax=uncultured Polaribacter sp. TaxID=174711 RepID=UPI002630228A|nr:hypothetical protein [uncultured Polaribacter sp.]